MRNWVHGIVIALIFALVGAFAASFWLEIRHDAPEAQGPPSGVWEGRSIRVEVLNGAGIQHLAKRATDRLRELDFDVVHYGNAEDFSKDSSVAIARVDSSEPARRVAEALGIRHVVQRPDRDLYLDVTVILGQDWVGEATEPLARDSASAGVWWARAVRAARRLWPE